MGNFTKQWLTFDNMVTPKIITVLYWILLVVVVISSITGMFFSFFSGLIGLILGIIGVRVYCELVILFFNIYGQIKRIADNLDNKSSNVNTDTPTNY